MQQAKEVLRDHQVFARHVRADDQDVELVPFPRAQVAAPGGDLGVGGIQLRAGGLGDVLQHERRHAAREREQRGARELATAGHIVEEGQGGGHDLLLPGECGGGEFQGVEAGLGGRDEFAQAGEGLEAIVVDGSVAGREGHINRERDVGDGLDGVVDRGPDVGFDAPSVAQQSEVIATDDQRGTGGGQHTLLAFGVGRAKRIVQRGEGRRLYRSGGRGRGLGRDASGGQDEQDGEDRVSEDA